MVGRNAKKERKHGRPGDQSHSDEGWLAGERERCRKKRIEQCFQEEIEAGVIKCR